MTDIRVLVLTMMVFAVPGATPGAEATAVTGAQVAQVSSAVGRSDVPAAVVADSPAVRRALIEKVQDLDLRSAPLKDFRARLAVTVKKGTRDYELSGMYAGNAAGDFRFSMNWGIISVLDVAFKGDQVELWLPRKGKLCRGPRSLFEEIPNDIRLLERIGSVRDLFFPEAWDPQAFARRLDQSGDRHFLNVIGRRDGELWPLRRVQLGSFGNHCIVEKTILFDEGVPTGAVEYRDYYEISGWLIPRTVEVWASATTRIVLHVEGIAINTDRPLELTVHAPSGQKEADLAETLKAGKLLE